MNRQSAYWLAISAAFTPNALGQVIPPTPIQQCALALQQDLYKYSSSVSLKEDFLRTVNEETYKQMQKDLHTWGSYFKVIEGGLDYKQFDENRRKYFETVHYKRDYDSALAIVWLTTKPRAYASYDKCLETLADGPALKLWVESEDPSSMVVKISYRPPVGGTPITLSGTVQGGQVSGVPTGKLFKTRKLTTTWEHRVNVVRTVGTPTTVVTIAPSRYSAPQIWRSTRSDGWIEVVTEGNAEAVVGRREAKVLTENNDGRDEDKNCRSKVGAVDGFCLSGNRSSIQAEATQFFTDATSRCEGSGCSWTRSVAASISADGRTLGIYGENWGPVATLFAIANLHQRYGTNGASCGSAARIPVIVGQPVVLTTNSACKPIAVVSYSIDGASGIMKMDAAQGDGTIARNGDLVETPGLVYGTYVLQSSPIPQKSWWERLLSYADGVVRPEN
jgi:hypothetical protein